LPRSAFDRGQIAGNMRRSLAIRYKPDRDHSWLTLTRLRQLRSQSSTVQTRTHRATAGIWQSWLTAQCCMAQGGDWEAGRCCSISSQLNVVQQWVVVGKRNSSVSYYQTDCSGGQATRDFGGGKMVACGVTSDVQLLVTRRRWWRHNSWSRSLIAISCYDVTIIDHFIMW